MRISLSDAKVQLGELMRRAESGEEVILTRGGRASVRLVPVKKVMGRKVRRAILEQISKAAAARAKPGASAARSQDFLYDKSGLPK
jgi:prevent-host-death family protein